MVTNEEKIGMRVIAVFLPQTLMLKEIIPIFDANGDRVRFEFDVTDQILKMGKEAALKITDMDYDADALWHAYVEKNPEQEHDGPFEVVVEDAIADFFGKKSAREKISRDTLAEFAMQGRECIPDDAVTELLRAAVNIAEREGCPPLKREIETLLRSFTMICHHKMR